MAQCGVCGQTVSRDPKGTVDCCLCKKVFHGKYFKFEAKDVESLKALNKAWTCPTCSKARKTVVPDERPASPSRSAGGNPEPSLSEVMAAIRRLASEVGSMKGDLGEIKDSLEKQASLSFENSARLDKIESHLASQNAVFDELRQENSNLKSRVSDLEVRLARAEQEHRCKTVEIRGIPERAGDTPEGLVTLIGNGLGVRIGAEDLDSMQRLRQRKDDPRPPLIVAKFVRQSLRDEVIRLRRVKRNFTTKDIGWTEQTSLPIYISEDMTPTNRHLYWLARQKKISGKVKYVWFSEGKVKCRKADGLPVVVIAKPEDLDSFS